MKASHLLLAGSFFATTAFADLTISQQIEQEPAAGGKGVDMTMTMKIKGEKFRVDPNPDVTTITNTKTGDTTTIMNQQKVFVEVPGETVKKLQKAALEAALDRAGAQATEAANAPVPQATGNKQTINGFACEEYVSDEKDTKMTVWTTKDIPNSDQLLKELATISPEMNPLDKALKTQQVPGFPIRIIIENPRAGKMTVTASGLSQDALPDSDFVPPAGFKKMKMPGQ